MIVLIDNYDSFTYNLYQMMGEILQNVNENYIAVYRNDEVTIEDIAACNPEAIVISPGPGYPGSAGISIEAVRHFAGKVPILGVCLGHQSIAEAFGGRIVHAPSAVHGKASEIKLCSGGGRLFKGLPQSFTAGRYHSLVVEPEPLPDCLAVTSTCGSVIMSLEHKQYDIFGVQFHPESVLSGIGGMILKNFLDIANTGKYATALVTSVNFEIPKISLKPYIKRTVERENLSEDDAREAMKIIMDGLATDAQIAAFLAALRMKGETIDEITGFAKGMREKATRVLGCADGLDIVGTGGDLANSFNISTTSAFVCAGAGAKVVKHGNRSVSSMSGAADVLQSLGAKISSDPAKVEAMANSVGVAFLFAQTYHGSMRHVGPARRDTGIRTVFNILGPLSNPAFNDYIVLGVYEEELLEVMARVLVNLGIKRAAVLYGRDRLDEASVSAATAVCEVNGGGVRNYVIEPEEFGLGRYSKRDIVGGTPEENAKITLAVLGDHSGESGDSFNAKRDIVLLNSGIALYVCGVAGSIQAGVDLARAAIADGRALAKLREYVESSNA